MIEPAPNRGIILRCTRGHEQWIYTPGYPRTEAERLAGIMDGRSPDYVVSPRADATPSAVIGKCTWHEPLQPSCGAAFDAEVFGYD
jgi:hypothetical protein